MLFVPVTGWVTRRALTVTHTDALVDSGDQSSYTFNNVAIGAAPPAGRRRFVTVCVYTFSPNGLITGLDSFTIGGVTAFGGFTGISQSFVAIGHAEVSSGTTTTVFINPPTTMAGMGISVFSVISGPNGIDTEVVGNHVSPIDLTVDVPAGGVVVATAGGRGSNGWTWTGLTEASDEDINTDDHIGAAYKAFAAAQTNYAIQATAVSSPTDSTGMALILSPASA